MLQRGDNKEMAKRFTTGGKRWRRLGAKGTMELQLDNSIVYAGVHLRKAAAQVLHYFEGGLPKMVINDEDFLEQSLQVTNSALTDTKGLPSLPEAIDYLSGDSFADLFGGGSGAGGSSRSPFQSSPGVSSLDTKLI